MHPIDHRDDTACEPLPSIGGYQIVRQIGRGGMSNVYCARSQQDQSTVALKVLDTRFALDSAMRQRFQREVEVIQSLSHDHIVPLYGYGNEQGTPFLAMQLIDGVTVAELIRYLQMEAERSDDDFDPPDSGNTQTQVALNSGVIHLAAACFAASRTHDCIFKDIAELIASAADALEEAHRNGIIHRDIKPSNMMVDREGRLWLTDFGLASVEEAHTVVTNTGEMIGTPHYMSPEQATANRESIDHHTDIYSLGASLYELATLNRPYRGERFRVLMEISTGRLTPPSRVCPEIPKPLEAIILRAMEYSPSDRYASIAEMAEDLRRFARGRAIAARPRSLSDRIVRLILRNPRVSVGTATAVAAVALLIMGIMFSHSSRLSELNSQLQQAKESIDQVNVEIARQSDQLNANRDRLRKHLYIADVSAAYRAYADWDVDAVQQLLSRHAPAADELLEDADLRGFEWNLLNQLCALPESRIVGKHLSEAREIVLLPGQETCLTAGDDGFVRHWNLQDGQLIVEHQIGAGIDALAVSPDGRSFVAGVNSNGTNTELTVRHIESGEPIQRLQNHKNSVESVAFSPDGQLIVSADRYNEVALHRTTGERLAKRKAGSRNESLGFTPDGKHVACIFREPNRWQTFQLWSIPDLKLVQQIKSDLRPTVFAFSGNGRYLLLANDSELALHNWPEAKPLLNQRDLRDHVRCVALNHDGTAIHAGCDNGMLFVWKITEQQLEETNQSLDAIPRMIPTGKSMITSMAIKASGEAVIATESGSIQQWQSNSEISTPRSLDRIIHRVAPTKGNLPELIVRSPEGAVQRFDPIDQQFVTLQKVPKDGEKTVAVSQDGRLIVASAPRELYVLSGPTGKTLRRIDHAHGENQTKALLFSAEGRRLFHLMGNSFEVYDTSPPVEEWKATELIEFKSDSSRDLIESTAANRIFVITSELLLFDAGSYQLLERVPCEFGHYSSINIFDDGSLLVLGCRDGTIEVRQLPDLQRLALLRGHRSSIRQCVFIDDAQETLVSCTHDELRFWDLPSERDLGRLSIPGSIYDLHFSPQTNTLHTFQMHLPVQSWSVQSNQPVFNSSSLRPKADGSDTLTNHQPPG